MLMKRSRVDTVPELKLALPADTDPPQNATMGGGSAGPPPPMKLGEFLKKCHYCKKVISENVEVYMYRDFCGFCSAACREIQISLDKLSEKQVSSSNDSMNHSNDSMNQ